MTLVLVCMNSSVYAALIGVGPGDVDERSALVGTLTSLGHTVTDVIDGSLDLIVSAPGVSTSDFAGVPYLQISDWGADHLANSWASHAQSTPVTVTLDGTHLILTGVDASWSTFGFWQYGDGSNYVGWVTGVPGLADADVLGTPYNEVLAVSGSDIYIGWNVYGPDATPNDLQILSNSIQFLVSGTVAAGGPMGPAKPVPVMSVYGLGVTILGLFALATRRLSRRKPR